MEQLIATFMLMASTFMQLPVPAEPPKIEIVEQSQISSLVCVKPEQCSDIFFFYAHKDNKIMVAKGVNLEYTFSRAEILREVGRHIMYVNGVYKPSNSCAMNMELENFLISMEMDFILEMAKENRYTMHPEGGLPEGETDLGKRIWFCNPNYENEINI